MHIIHFLSRHNFPRNEIENLTASEKIGIYLQTERAMRDKRKHFSSFPFFANSMTSKYSHAY
jgi:hypothetical protein